MYFQVELNKFEFASLLYVQHNYIELILPTTFCMGKEVRQHIVIFYLANIKFKFHSYSYIPWFYAYKPGQNIQPFFKSTYGYDVIIDICKARGFNGHYSI